MTGQQGFVQREQVCPRLTVHSAADGQILAEHSLPTSPLRDGLAVAIGLLDLVCNDGTLYWFGKGAPWPTLDDAGWRPLAHLEREEPEPDGCADRLAAPTRPQPCRPMLNAPPNRLN